VQLGQIRAQPKCTVRGAARGRAGHDPRARRGPRPRSALHVRPVCAALAAQLGLGRRDTREAAEEQRLTGAGTAARRRRAVGTAARSVRRRSGRGGVGEAVGTAVRLARRRSGRGGAERLSGCDGAEWLSGAARAGRGSCRDARRAIPTVALSWAIGVARGSQAAAARGD
jgi:hypothetical protein